ncbi:MAG: (2Fe-2S)-binding protein [Sandaracinaceae bacterium]|jgi:NADH-quinone oxidoreductase subunit G|nr:(2Fe-2S)-binding protein [Sandaracinaceae bacterium]MBK7155978.1 (2Fe-2S)-binding protein [Sandaracinaceae bacterium]MBK7775666.1 (2Fe-2S)-binding protein [Sandaracinaceae bacterium]MBK8406346.1 (2Fe-2S)-binding protein [Sandaracinaceae bacterium]MBP7683930.1 (2Fe-2S)-binding protein [Deltaproteobacteria bacterium]
MSTFTLNGRQIAFEAGETIMQAAWRSGIEIPHYCWHPGLSVAANCRMCLVHIESGRQMAMPIVKWDEKKKAYVPDTKPKLTPACQQTAAEGMVISSESAEVKQAQAAVQEFLLLNHPVDCPICDQAGECKLQDYYYEHQSTVKRKRTEPVHKPKGVRFGPTIVYDAERCIMCTRCIRVCDELAGDHVLDMRERGNRNEITVAQGRELDHRYTLMTEHVCPVGALTSSDFRFKARVWFLKSQEGVCSGCATGCNTHVDFDPRYGKVYRLRPRDNMDVNKFWMCDDGMMTYRRQSEDRVLTASLGRGDARVPAFGDEPFQQAARQLGSVTSNKIGVVLSAQHSNEDNYALAQLAKKLGTSKVYLAGLDATREGWVADAILRSADPNPNTAGARVAAGGSLDETTEDLLQDILGGEVEAVIALGAASLETLAELEALTKLDAVISLTSHVGALPAAASVVLPVASVFETHGTFVNQKGMHQAFRRAVSAQGGVEPGWKTVAKLAEALGHDLALGGLQDIRTKLAATAGAGATSGGAEARA